MVSELRKNFADVWSLLAFTAVCLLAIQYLTLRSLRDFVLARTTDLGVADIRERGVGWILESATDLLGPMDYALILGLLAALGILTYMEILQARLSRFLDYLRARPSRMLVFVGLVSAIVARAYLNPGQVFMGDAETHTLRSWMVAEHLRSMSIPVWSNYWYGGYPLLEYYAPGFFLLVGGLSLVLPDVDAATKLVLWLSHVGSSITMYLYLKETTRDELGALVGALAYTLIFHRMHIVLYQGDLQLSLVFLIYPLLFLFAEKHIHRPVATKRGFIIFTLTATALILSHHGYAFFGISFFVLYLIVRVPTSSQQFDEKLRTLGYFTLALAAATLMSAFLLMPFVFEQYLVRGMPNLPFRLLIPNYLGPTILADMLDWTPVPKEQNVGYVGLTVLLMAALSTVWAFATRCSPAISAFVAGFATLLLVQSFTQYNIKNVNFFVFFVSTICCYTPRALAFFYGKWKAFENSSADPTMSRGARLTLIAAALLLVELGPLTFQNVYREGYTFKQDMYARILQKDSAYRVIERQVLSYDPDTPLADQFIRGKLGTISAFVPLQTPHGYFHEGAGKSYAYNVEITKQLHRDLNAGTISETTLDGLYLMGVKYLILRDRFDYFRLPVEPSRDVVLDEEILELRHTQPILMSPSVVSLFEVPGYDPDNIIATGDYFDSETYDYDNQYFESLVLPLIRHMSIDRRRGTADRLIVQGGTQLSGARKDARSMTVEVRDVEVDIDSVRIAYRASADGYARLAYSYFPYLRIEVDGSPASFYPSAMRYIVMELPAGAHVVTITGVASPMRRATMALSLVVLGILLIVPKRYYRLLDRRSGPGPVEDAE